MLHEPLVSILMAVKNESRFIDEALESIRDQDYERFEALVVDDNSGDDTHAKVCAIARDDSRIRCLRATGRGKVAAFNQAWHASRGDVIVLFAGDDLLAADSLRRRVALLSDSGCEVAAGKIRSFSSNRKYDGLLLPRKPGVPNLGGGAIALTRRFASRVFPIPERLPNEDLWTRLHIDYFCPSVARSDQVVLHYRIHENNSTAFGAPFQVRASAVGKRHAAYGLFIDKYRDVLDRGSLRRLEALQVLERCRAAGDISGIVRMSGVSWRQKLGALSFSNELLYGARLMFERYLVGR